MREYNARTFEITDDKNQELTVAKTVIDYTDPEHDPIEYAIVVLSHSAFTLEKRKELQLVIKATKQQIIDLGKSIAAVFDMDIPKPHQQTRECDGCGKPRFCIKDEGVWNCSNCFLSSGGTTEQWNQMIDNNKNKEKEKDADK